jgi:hypothetical protein
MGDIPHNVCMDETQLRREKIQFIRQELKSFYDVKRKCKYAYKNWFRERSLSQPTPKASPYPSSPFGLWESPQFPEMGDTHYFNFYGKLYITCLHIIYNKIRRGTDNSHLHNVNPEVYTDNENIVNAWIDEKLAFQRLK